jgi:hypothetical protein
MTPAARLSAAIEVLDAILLGQAPEMVLTNWGRANRFAGSGDRGAIRDLVYDALRWGACGRQVWRKARCSAARATRHPR